MLTSIENTRFRLAELSGNVRRWRFNRSVDRLEGYVQEIDHLQTQPIPTDPEQLDGLIKYSGRLLSNMAHEHLYMLKVTMNDTLELSDEVKERITPHRNAHEWYADLLNVRYRRPMHRE